MSYVKKLKFITRLSLYEVAYQFMFFVIMAMSPLVTSESTTDGQTNGTMMVRMLMGDATRYEGVSGMTSCTKAVNVSSEFFTSISYRWFNDRYGEPRNDPLCSGTICAVVIYLNRRIKLPIVDQCRSCEEYELQLSKRAFNILGYTEGGRLFCIRNPMDMRFSQKILLRDFSEKHQKCLVCTQNAKVSTMLGIFTDVIISLLGFEWTFLYWALNQGEAGVERDNSILEQKCESMDEQSQV
uniref:Uncharacterized protein n=1 Tax=Romanomermis culicivorax TaxID=13658 RepID=A0A915J2E9_ROMCU